MKINILCELCGKDFSRELSEVNRNKRLGRRNFCNRSCQNRATIFEKIPENKRYNVTHLKKGSEKDEFSPFRYTLKKIKNRKKIKCEITLVELKELWERQNGICPYTGIEMVLEHHNSRKKPNSASLDRIDSSKGYSKDNIQFICCSINLAKCDFSDEQMKDFIQMILDN